MARPKKVAEEVVGGDVSTDESPLVNEPANPQIPLIDDPEWSDWLTGQLLDDEKDGEGHPKVDGLRRLARVYLGTVLHSATDRFEGATQANNMRCTSSYLVKIAWNGDVNDVRTFGGLADVYSGNADDAYARFAAAFCETRAEGRALRKALGLKNAVTAEEITKVSVKDSGISGYIVSPQLKGITKLCSQLDIDMTKFINSGSKQYEDVTDIKYNTAQAMVEQLNKYLQNRDTIPDSIKI